MPNIPPEDPFPTEELRARLAALSFDLPPELEEVSVIEDVQENHLHDPSEDVRARLQPVIESLWRKLGSRRAPGTIEPFGQQPSARQRLYELEDFVRFW